MNNLYICASNNPRMPDEEQPSYCIDFVAAKNRYYALKLFRAHNDLHYEEKTTCQRLRVCNINQQMFPELWDETIVDWDNVYDLTIVDWDNVYYGLPTRSGWSELGWG